MMKAARAWQVGAILLALAGLGQVIGADVPQPAVVGDGPAMT